MIARETSRLLPIETKPDNTLDLLKRSTSPLAAAAQLLVKKNISGAHDQITPFIFEGLYTSAPMPIDDGLASRKKSAKAMLDWADNSTNTQPYFSSFDLDTLHILQDTVEAGLWLADLLFDHTPQNTKASTPYTAEYMQFLRFCERVGTARNGYAVGIKNEIQALIRAASTSSPQVKEERANYFALSNSRDSSPEALEKRKKDLSEKNVEWEHKQRQWEEQKREQARKKYDEAVKKLRGADLLRDIHPSVMTSEELKALEARNAGEKAAVASESRRRQAFPINTAITNIITSIPPDARKDLHLVAADISVALQHGQYQSALTSLDEMRRKFQDANLPEVISNLDPLYDQIRGMLSYATPI